MSDERAPEDGLSDAQKEYLSESHLRNVLNAAGNDIEPNVTWVNAMESYVESLASEDEPIHPRQLQLGFRRSDAAGGYTQLAVTDISVWPNSLGSAATFNPDTVLEFGKMASSEYRALGINMALSPQIDLATDPRWSRSARIRTSPASWQQLILKASRTRMMLTESRLVGAIVLWRRRRSTSQATARARLVASPTRTLASMRCTQAAMRRGRTSRSSRRSTQPLSCCPTQLVWQPTASPAFGDLGGDGLRQGKGSVAARCRIRRRHHDRLARHPQHRRVRRPWGKEKASIEERHYAILQSDVDMYGGNNDIVPLDAAYDQWQADFEAGRNEIDADTRARQSGERIVRMIFNNGAYENPYVDLESSKKIVGSEDKIEAD